MPVICVIDLQFGDGHAFVDGCRVGHERTHTRPGAVGADDQIKGLALTAIGDHAIEAIGERMHVLHFLPSGQRSLAARRETTGVAGCDRSPAGRRP